MHRAVQVGRMQPNHSIHSDPIQKTGEQIQADTQTWLDNQPLRTLCSLCDWTLNATALEGREAARAHRQERHPDARQPKRARQGVVHRWRRTPEGDRDRDAAMAEIEQRRAAG